MNTLLEKYTENEENNDHAVNFCLLADNFGDESDMFICSANLNFRNKFGYASHDLSAAAYQCTKKYIALLK
jgi:hypothetical protein